MRARSTLSIVVALAAAVALAGTGPAATASPDAGAVSAARQVKPPSYHNPLRLALPGGKQAASCADPFAAHSSTRGDKYWYLYCTTDALSASEKDASGKLVMHNVPMYRSTDLTHWKYVGDAFPTTPAWLGSGSVWAPDVVHRNGKYFLYYAASDTAAGGSAVGVATSKSPTGPWVDSGAPVVEPTDAPNSTSKRWEFDPEVITAGGKSYVYFGSYFGGIHVRELTADGLHSVASSEKQIAIDNRYEGTFIVKHAGWYYFMGSATNCCSGPLTGYSVFTARSRSPLGPFLDRDGVSILANRVGGTPVLTQNGNRWVGAGHNAVVTDFAGQNWIVYHAVDRTDPYYAGDVGYTKRPVLIDPLDWQHGWPVVRGGRGPSDSVMPGPVAQPDERATYHPSFIQQPKPAAAIRGLSDDFSGSSLSSKWSWIRQPASSTYNVSGGSLNWQTQAADLQPPATPLASVLTEAAPKGDYVLEARVSVNTPNSDAVQNYVQGGLIVYGDDGNYVRLTSNSIFNTRQTEFGNHVSPVPAGYPSYGNGVVGPVGDWTYLRIVHRGSAKYTAYTSLDGKHWDRGDTWTHALGSKARIGLISLGGSGFTTRFAYVHVNHLAATR